MDNYFQHNKLKLLLPPSLVPTTFNLERTKKVRPKTPRLASNYIYVQYLHFITGV